MSVDGSFIMANASHHSRIPREKFTEAAQVNYGACQELVLIEPGETTDWRKSSTYTQMPVGKEKWKQ